MMEKKARINDWIGLTRVLTALVIAFNLTTVKAADQYTVELYETYCKACHTVDGAGVPVAFNESDWQQRLNAGLDSLVNNAVNGVGNMPAQGSCMECTYEDFEELINYMSAAKSE